MMIVEPVGADKWDAVVSAAAYACRTPDIGRKLTGFLAQAGFLDIDIQVFTRPDREGRLLPMVRNITEYGRQGGQIDSGAIDALLADLDQALIDKTYLVLAPKFVVTGRR